MVGRPCGQFQGESSWDRCSRMSRISRLSSALPIMMEERQAREASMARTLRRMGTGGWGAWVGGGRRAQGSGGGPHGNGSRRPSPRLSPSRLALLDGLGLTSPAGPAQHPRAEAPCPGCAPPGGPHHRCLLAQRQGLGGTAVQQTDQLQDIRGAKSDVFAAPGGWVCDRGVGTSRCGDGTQWHAGKKAQTGLELTHTGLRTPWFHAGRLCREMLPATQPVHSALPPMPSSPLPGLPRT